MFILVT